jgi:DNA-binding IclR family transcriptional regulator
MDEHQRKALRLIASGGRLTDLGNATVSRHAQTLKTLGFVRENPRRWIAYELTAEGKIALNA